MNVGRDRYRSRPAPIVQGDEIVPREIRGAAGQAAAIDVLAGSGEVESFAPDGAGDQALRQRVRTRDQPQRHVVALFHQIGESILEGDIDQDLRIALAILGEQRRQLAGGGEARQVRRSVPRGARSDPSSSSVACKSSRMVLQRSK